LSTAGIERRGVIPAISLVLIGVCGIVYNLLPPESDESRLQRVANQAGIAMVDVMRSIAASCRHHIDYYEYDAIMRNPMIVPTVAKGQANGHECLARALRTIRVAP
jgi:hypothetical protein